MIDSLFYYPMTLHRGGVSASVLAPFVKNLPPVSGVVEEIYVRTQDSNPAGAPGFGVYGSALTNGVVSGQGAYVWDAIDNRFRFVLPYDVVCEGVISGSYVDIYYALTGTGATIPAGATAYRNGALYSGANFTTNDKAVWAVVTSPAVVAGSVKTVQGVNPDSNGNITLPFASEIAAGLVRIGQNLSIDSNGVLSADASSDYTLPAATTSTLGGVIVGSGLGVAVDGTVNADVISVNGKQGAVVLSASDITTGTFGASQLGGTPGDNEVLITNAAGVPTWVSTLPTANLPSSILGAVEYQGTFVPGTTTLPAAATANKGWYYVASTSGTYTPPGGTQLTFAAGDWLISNGSEWDTVNNGGAVTSVNGQTGAVTIQAVDNNDASGTTLISNSGSSNGVVKLKTLVSGTGVTISPDANGNLVIGSSGVSSFNTRTGAVSLQLSDVTAVGGAPIASPSLTGTPTAPTATAGTDNTQIATTAFVMGAVASGVAGVSSFNTRTGAVTLQLSDVTGVGGAPLASPALTGTPTAPTPVSGDNSTNIATTAFVAEAVAAGAVGSIATFEFIATSGQTVFPATFASGAVVEVFLNGDLLFTTDYSTNGGVGPVTLNTGATLDDEVKVIATAPFNVANVVPITGGAYTGVVQGLTASPGDNSTQFATTAFVENAIGGISSGVSSFNTRVGAVTLQLSDVTGVGGAPLASPALTGVPTAPTATAGTNTTQVATTAFVAAAVSAGAVSSFNTRTGAVTLQLTDVTGVGGAPLASPTFTGVPAAPTATAGTSSTQLATTAFVATSFAPLASPALTGTPTAPTATPGTNTTQLATTAFVTAAVSGSGVTSFNTRTGAVTLVAADVTSAGGALLASPTFTGVPAAPTATAGTNTTQLATTAFVTSAVSAAGGVSSFNTRTGAVTLQASDVTGVGGALLASPTFTGVPAAPTASTGTNSTTLATTNYVYGATQGQTTIPLTNANVTLSAAQYSNPAIKLTGTLTGSVVLTFPTTGNWNIYNATTGAFTVTLSNGAGATVVIPQANTLGIMSDVTAGILSSSSSGGAVTSVAGRTGAIVLSVGDVSGAAPLASPALTGVPTAPTAAVGTSTTQLATTAFVTGQASTTTPNMDGTAAIGTSTSFARADHVHASDTSRAPLASPTFTGVPAAPTATAGTNTTQVATTAFVTTAVTGLAPLASPSFTGRVQSVASSYTVVALGSVSGTQTLDLATATEWTMTITGATTLAFTNTLGAGLSEVVYLRFTNAGSAAITWPASTKFAAATAPTFTASGTDVVGVKYDTTTSTYMVFVIGLAIA
jgi:hypothetical protein